MLWCTPKYTLDEFPCPIVYRHFPWVRLSRCWTCLSVVLYFPLLNLIHIKPFWFEEMTKKFFYVWLGFGKSSKWKKTFPVMFFAAARTYNAIMQTEELVTSTTTLLDQLFIMFNLFSGKYFAFVSIFVFSLNLKLLVKHWFSVTFPCTSR